MTQSLRSRDSLGLLLGFIGVVIFGITLPATRIAVMDLHPWFVTCGRAALAGFVALALMAVLRRTPPPRREWPQYALAAACLTLGFPGFVALAMQTVPAAQGGVVLGILPLGTAIASALMTGERPSRAFWGFAALGSALIVLFTLRRAGGFALTIGDLYLGLAVVSTAVGYTASAVLSRTRPGWEMVSWMLVLALPVSLPLAIVFAPADVTAIRTPAILAFLYVAFFSQYIGFFFWNAGLAMGGIARVGQVQLLQTFVTLGAAALLVGETIDAEMLVFAGAVVAVVVASSRVR
jgi:drug/metabolite transporter (DMT)-like permease